MIIEKKKNEKIHKRKYDGDVINYSFLKKDEGVKLRVYYKKQNSGNWEIIGEIDSEKYKGRSVKFICNSNFEKKIHRGHSYIFKIKKVFMGSIEVYSKFKKK